MDNYNVIAQQEHVTVMSHYVNHGDGDFDS